MLTDVPAAHSQYWASHGGSPNPAAFGPGFSQGWDDALLFLTHTSGASVIGFMEQWLMRRRWEFEGANGQLGPGAWEWDTGFRQGVDACRGACPR
jgi:hypothetical protein